MISLSNFFVILGLLGAVVGVWAVAEIKIATLSERLRGVKENHAKMDFTIDRIFQKLEGIENKINQKADR